MYLNLCPRRTGEARWTCTTMSKVRGRTPRSQTRGRTIGCRRNTALVKTPGRFAWWGMNCEVLPPPQQIDSPREGIHGGSSYHLTHHHSISSIFPSGISSNMYQRKYVCDFSTGKTPRQEYFCVVEIGFPVYICMCTWVFSLELISRRTLSTRCCIRKFFGE